MHSTSTFIDIYFCDQIAWHPHTPQPLLLDRLTTTWSSGSNEKIRPGNWSGFVNITAVIAPMWQWVATGITRMSITVCRLAAIALSSAWIPVFTTLFESKSQLGNRLFRKSPGEFCSSESEFRSQVGSPIWYPRWPVKYIFSKTSYYYRNEMMDE